MSTATTTEGFDDFDVPPTRLRSVRGAYAVVAGCAMMVTQEENWTASRALAMAEETVRIAHRRHPHTSLTHFEGEAPDARSRVALAGWMLRVRIPQPKRVITITDSAVIRGAAMAYGWLSGTEQLVFTPGQHHEAIAVALANFDERIRATALRTFQSLYPLCRVGGP